MSHRRSESASPYRRRRVLASLASLVLLAVIALGLAAGAGAFNGPPSLTRAQLRTWHLRQLSSSERKIAALAESNLNAVLPQSVGASEPQVASSLFNVALPSHVVVGYLPYWMLSNISARDLAGVSTVAYFALSLKDDGSIDQSGPGWADLSSNALASVMSRARLLGDERLLTVTTTSSTSITSLLRDPARSGASFARAVAHLVAEFGFSGVDLDIEGRSASERTSFLAFMRAFSATFRSLLAGDEIVLDTYPQSAGSHTDFFDVANLAPLVDQFFVMAYDMDNPHIASANDPLFAKNLGLSDVQSLLQYTRIVPRNEIVLGMPFYGYDFTLLDASGRASATEPVARLYSEIATRRQPIGWDPVTASPYSDFTSGGTAHELWFDDPASIAIRSSLASDFRVAGVGTWALGFEGASTAMIDALLGGSEPKRGS
jgi:hypothetical protein